MVPHLRLYTAISLPVFTNDLERLLNELASLLKNDNLLITPITICQVALVSLYQLAVLGCHLVVRAMLITLQ